MRSNLGAAGLTEAQWQKGWEAARLFLQADGEAGKLCGNLCITVFPDGTVAVELPDALRHLANAKVVLPRGWVLGTIHKSHGTRNATRRRWPWP